MVLYFVTLIPLFTFDEDPGSPEEDTGNESEHKFQRGQANESSYFDKLKEEIELQKQRNIAELNDLDADTRL